MKAKATDATEFPLLLKVKRTLRPCVGILIVVDVRVTKAAKGILPFLLKQLSLPANSPSKSSYCM
jgi:hypothetical protein